MPSKPATKQTAKTAARSGKSRSELGATDLDKVVGGVKPSGAKKLIICDPCGGGE